MDGQSISVSNWRSAASFPAARVWLAFAAIALSVGWALTSTGLFTVDEYFYARAAEAMAEDRSLSFQQFDVSGAPALDMNFARPAAEEGRLAPQYPSGYAIIAAPFFALFGLKGLVLLNAVSAFISLWLTYRIARALDLDEKGATAAAAILALGTYWSTYAFALWPHMLSLAIVLGVVERALASRSGEASAIAVAGLLAGLGQTVRIDMIVLAPAVIIWLRAFCEGDTRKRALIFAVSMAPGLALAAALNAVKLGQFNPFAYENAVVSNDESAFLPLALMAALCLAAAFFIDIRKFAISCLRSRVLAGAMIALTVGSLIAVTALTDLWRGYWYSMIDAQAYAHLERQAGIVRDQWGWLSFYGFSKKALAQSIPFLPLVALPLFRLAKGRLRRGEGLLLIYSGAFATLYAFNQTDSGLGLNARFLMPLLPAASIVAVLEIRRLQLAGGPSARALLKAGFLAAAGFFALRMNFAEAGPLMTPLDLYPQLGLAAMLSAAIAWHVVSNSRSAAAFASVLGAMAIGAASAISATDLLRDQAYRSYVALVGSRYQSLVPADSLVITSRPSFFADAALKRLSIAYPRLNSPARELAAVAAYQGAGRCVYVQGRDALSWLASAFPPPPRSAEPIGPPDAAIAAVPGNPGHCPGRPTPA